MGLKDTGQVSLYVKKDFDVPNTFTQLVRPQAQTLDRCRELRVVVDHQFDLGFSVEIPVFAVDLE